MSWLCDSSELIPGAWFTSAYTGLGVPGALVPGEGEGGPGFLFPSLQLGDETSEFLALITTPPTAGVLVVAEDTSFVWYGLPVGEHSFGFTVIQNGIALTPERFVRVTVDPEPGTVHVAGSIVMDAALASGSFEGVVYVAGSIDMGAVLPSGLFAGALPEEELSPAELRQMRDWIVGIRSMLSLQPNEHFLILTGGQVRTLPGLPAEEGE